ncbi:MAG: type III-B CRISPR module RAMP protein Cmr1 [Halanaerobiales bacterium]|nr:type III-B CRISPR module RAMP protein Cmr1 [Halanaerobiales bacterium]
MLEKKVQLKLKTPLWTGDRNRVCSELKETAILGSIRWWFRVIARQYGVQCCASESKFDSRRYKEKIAEEQKNGGNFYLSTSREGFSKRISAQLEALNCHCPECLIFGTTGRRKPFDLRVSGWEVVDLDYPDYLNGENTSINFMVRKYLNGEKGLKGFWQKEDFLTLNFIDIQSMDADNYFKILMYILFQISRLGSLGAKTQSGFGVFQIYYDGLMDEESKLLKEGKELFHLVIEEAKKIQKKEDKNQNEEIYPELNDMYFYRAKLNKSNLETILKKVYSKKTRKQLYCISQKKQYYHTGLLLRYYLRQQFKYKGIGDQVVVKEDKKRLVKYLFGGNIGEDINFGSKIYISDIYQVGEHENNNFPWEFKFWCWIPDDLNGGAPVKSFSTNSEAVINSIKSELMNLIKIDEFQIENIEPLDETDS